jgi:hypothetical protein
MKITSAIRRGRARVHARGSRSTVPAALVGVAIAVSLAALWSPRECGSAAAPCKYFDCGTASDTSGSPGSQGLFLVQLANQPVLAYSEALNGDLKVAHRAAVGWVTETVDAPGNVGSAPSMAVDGLGFLVISYYDVTNGDLKFARGLPGGSWRVESVDVTGRAGLYSSIATFPGGVGIAYYDSSLGALKYAEGGTVGGSWAIQVIDAGRGDTGLYPSLIAVDDRRAISYYDHTNGDLKLAIRTAGDWSTYLVDNDGDVGGWSSLCHTLDGYGIAYYDFTNTDLRFVWGSSPPWNYEVVDDVGDVGRYASAFAFSPLPEDQIGISYYDATSGDLKYAQKRGGSWTSFAVDSAGNVGGFTSCAGGWGPSDSLGIAYFDYTDDALRYASHLNPVLAVPGTGRGPAPRVTWARDATGAGGTIHYTVPVAGAVRLEIYDAQGRTVALLLHASRGAGDGELRWDGRDTRGRAAHSGVYYIRLDTPAGSAATPAVLTR